MKPNKAFDNVKSQVGYCGIWCGSCVAGNGLLRDLTARYEKLIKGYGVSQWAPSGFDFDEFMKGLNALKEIWLCPGCLQGGGQDDCEIRSCARKRKSEDCIECGKFRTCTRKKKLATMRSGALKAGLQVKDKRGNSADLIREWTAEMKDRWPDLLLFLDD